MSILKGPPTGLFVYLNGTFICVYPNDLSDKLIMAHADLIWTGLAFAKDRGCDTTYQLVHSTSYHVLGHDNRAGFSQLCDGFL